MKIRRLLPLAIATAMALAVVPTVPAHAITMAQIDAKVKGLRQRLISVGDAVEHAGEQLRAANAAITQHTNELHAASRQMRRLRAGISARAALLYMMGSEQWQVFADPGSTGVFADRMTYLEQLGNGQRREVEDIGALRAHAQAVSAKLRAAQQRVAFERSILLSKRAALQGAYNEMARLQQFLASFSRGIPHGSRGAHGIICPIPGGAPVSNDFGAPRPGGPHTGNDIHAAEGTPMVAVLPGTIVDLPGGWAGLGIMMRDPLGNEWLYAHGSARYVHVGEHVSQGKLIGRVGNTGNSWGPHLHFEYHPNGGAPVDPYPILSKIC